MRDFIEIIPCCGTLAFFVVLFGFIVVMRYLGYRETMALAEKGLVRPPRSDGKDTLRWGIVIAALGLALCVGLYPIGFVTGDAFPFGLGPWLLAGFIPMFFGLALVLIYVLTREEKKPEGDKLLKNGNGPEVNAVEPPPAAS
jgi:hypothetical protein